MKSKFFDKIAYNPIIAAVNNINIFEEALHSSCEILFLLTGSKSNQLVDEPDAMARPFMSWTCWRGFPETLLRLNISTNL